MKLSRVESWAEAQGTEASEGSREPVYRCALTQGWKEQSQGIPYEKGRQAQNYFAFGSVGVGAGGGKKQARLSYPDREPGHCPASKSGAARPQKGAPGCYPPSSFSILTHGVALGRPLILWATGLSPHCGYLHTTNTPSLAFQFPVIGYYGPGIKAIYTSVITSS